MLSPSSPWARIKIPSQPITSGNIDILYQGCTFIGMGSQEDMEKANPTAVFQGCAFSSSK